MNLELMCREAQTQVSAHVNRSAGQHLRAMRHKNPTEQQRIVSDQLYDLAMRLTDAGAKNVDALIEAYCEISGVTFPPQQMESVCQ